MNVHVILQSIFLLFTNWEIMKSGATSLIGPRDGSHMLKMSEMSFISWNFGMLGEREINFCLVPDFIYRGSFVLIT